MFFLYNLFIHVYSFLIKLSSIYNSKALKWIKGRKDIFYHIRSVIKHNEKHIWFHTASLGEFEQCRPVMEAFREKYPQFKIVLTFFSPSGFEIRKNYAGADHVFYLPADTNSNAERFLELINPVMVCFVKYEFWFNYIRQIHKRDTPLYFFSVKFRPSQYFFSWYGSWFRQNLKKINIIFVQDEISLQLLSGTGYLNGYISGDTRFDRVLSVANQKRSFPVVESFAANSKILIAGSTWPPDEEMLTQLINKQTPGLKYIVAPHEVDYGRIASFQSSLTAPAIRFSEATAEKIAEATVLIIDNIGMLLHLYQYADIGYIGGGFGKNVHNILEASTFGVPVVFGPNYHKFQEIIDLIKLGGAFPVNNYQEFESVIQKLNTDETFRNKCSAICKNFVSSSAGATEIILEKITNDIKL